MATIKFFLQSQNNPAGIYVRLRSGTHTDAKAKTKFVINPSDWSTKKGQPKNLKDEGFKKLNNDLKKLGSDLLSHYNKWVDKKPITSTWLKEFINPTPQEEVPTHLFDYFDYYIKMRKNDITSSTEKKLNVIKNLLVRIQKEYSKKFLIAEVDNNFKLLFESYSLKEKYAKNTTSRNLKYIKTMCKHARIHGIETSPQLDNIKVSLQKLIRSCTRVCSIGII